MSDDEFWNQHRTRERARARSKVRRRGALSKKVVEAKLKEIRKNLTEARRAAKKQDCHITDRRIQRLRTIVKQAVEQSKLKGGMRGGLAKIKKAAAARVKCKRKSPRYRYSSKYFVYDPYR